MTRYRLFLFSLFYFLFFVSLHLEFLYSLYSLSPLLPALLFFPHTCRTCAASYIDLASCRFFTNGTFITFLWKYKISAKHLTSAPNLNIAPKSKKRYQNLNSAPNLKSAKFFVQQSAPRYKIFRRDEWRKRSAGCFITWPPRQGKRGKRNCVLQTRGEREKWEIEERRKGKMAGEGLGHAKG